MTFPEKLTPEEMQVCIKEWKLAGIAVFYSESRGCYHVSQWDPGAYAESDDFAWYRRSPGTGDWVSSPWALEALDWQEL